MPLYVAHGETINPESGHVSFYCGFPCRATSPEDAASRIVAAIGGQVDGIRETTAMPCLDLASPWYRHAATLLTEGGHDA